MLREAEYFEYFTYFCISRFPSRNGTKIRDPEFLTSTLTARTERKPRRFGNKSNDESREFESKVPSNEKETLGYKQNEKKPNNQGIKRRRRQLSSSFLRARKKHPARSASTSADYCADKTGSWSLKITNQRRRRETWKGERTKNSREGEERGEFATFFGFTHVAHRAMLIHPTRTLARVIIHPLLTTQFRVSLTYRNHKRTPLPASAKLSPPTCELPRRNEREEQAFAYATRERVRWLELRRENGKELYYRPTFGILGSL